MMHVALSLPLGMTIWAATVSVWPSAMTILCGPLIVSGVVLATALLPGKL